MGCDQPEGAMNSETEGLSHGAAKEDVRVHLFSQQRQAQQLQNTDKLRLRLAADRAPVEVPCRYPRQGAMGQQIRWSLAGIGCRR
jgi:hypothetical protein